MPDPSLIECFDNPNPKRDYVIEHVAEEFTSVCPKTGHPDFGVVTVQYIPDKICVELKSLKIYLQAFRNEGIFYEAVTNKIAEDLEKAMAPRWMSIITDWRGRGGIRSTIRVEVGRLPGAAPVDDGYDDDDDDDDADYEAPHPNRPPGF